MSARKIINYIAAKYRLGAEMRGTTAGMEVGIPLGGGEWMVGLVPIDDESNEAFADDLVRKWHKAKEERTK